MSADAESKLERIRTVISRSRDGGTSLVWPRLAFAAALLSGCGEEEPHPFALACARLSACLTPDLGDGSGVRRTGYDECRIASFDQRVQETWVRIERCVGAATDCPAVRACIGATGESCTSDDDSCDGSLARVCFAGSVTVRDCALDGLDCEGAGRCLRTAGCNPRCEGDRALVCSPQPIIPGYEYVTQCEPSLCHVGEFGASCHASAESCSFSWDESFCDGDTATTCTSGRIRRRQCAPGSCGPAGCASIDCTSTCDGENLIACVPDASPQAVSCAQIGAERCESPESGARCAGGELAM